MEMKLTFNFLKNSPPPQKNLSTSLYVIANPSNNEQQAVCVTIIKSMASRHIQ